MRVGERRDQRKDRSRTKPPIPQSRIDHHNSAHNNKGVHNAHTTKCPCIDDPDRRPCDRTVRRSKGTPHNRRRAIHTSGPHDHKSLLTPMTPDSANLLSAVQRMHTLSSLHLHIVSCGRGDKLRPSAIPQATKNIGHVDAHSVLRQSEQFCNTIILLPSNDTLINLMQPRG